MSFSKNNPEKKIRESRNDALKRTVPSFNFIVKAALRYDRNMVPESVKAEFNAFLFLKSIYFVPLAFCLRNAVECVLE